MNGLIDADAVRKRNKVLDIVHEIVEKSVGDEFLYRGEPEHYERVSSSLYREYKELGGDEDALIVEGIQSRLLEQTRSHEKEIRDDLELLSRLQHLGGWTNLIDFSVDYTTALYFASEFASEKSLEENGRIILLRKSSVADYIVEPLNPRNRVLSQRSVFVRPPKGFIDVQSSDMVTVNIPKEIKRAALEYLEDRHGISLQTVYNDIHGFIQHQKRYHEQFKEFFKGVVALAGADAADKQNDQSESE